LTIILNALVQLCEEYCFVGCVFDKNLHFKWMCCLNLQLSFLPWRWREHVPLKNHKFFTNLHRITLQKTLVFIVPIVATSALMNINQYSPKKY
jgi:hypothetical protein